MIRYSDKTSQLLKDLPDVLSVSVLAETFAVSVHTVYGWIDSGLPILPLPKTKRIAKADFLRWMEVKGKINPQKRNQR
ncbi:MAG TPA: helix-turn-helix domain-containing protein [Anaerohalosphaeraceae bacterium]|nr:helix-turn-helix domain-containing protein [Anaerohalosphaeraceae bacterium]